MLDYKFRYTFEHTVDHDEIEKRWTLSQIEKHGGEFQQTVQELKKRGYIIVERVLTDIIF